jgi:hypothetical protein
VRPLRALPIAALCAALAACAEETPLRAIYEIAHELEHEDAEGVCARLFPSGLLPPTIATALGGPPEHSGASLRWEAENARCVRQLGHSGAYAHFSFERPIVRGVEDVAVRPRGGITAAARARLELDGQKERIVRLVGFRGLWRLVITP